MPSARSVSRLRPLIIILGPTASGKSSLGVRLAKKFRGVVISADSRQVYRGLDIGTGKIMASHMGRVPHFLLDVASPKTQYSAAAYVRDVRRALKKIPAHRPIFLVGGSPYYIDALTKPDRFSTVPPNPALRRRLEQKTTAQLVALLRQKKPSQLQTIDTANRRRLIRAIEIASSRRHHQPQPLLPTFAILKIGLSIPNRQLFPQIDRRVDTRLRQGMVNEVRRLHRRGLSWARLDALGLEYRFLSRFLQGQLTKVEAVAQLKTAIHNFARRQMTWWKRDAGITWITQPNQADRLVKKFLSL